MQPTATTRARPWIIATAVVAVCGLAVLASRSAGVAAAAGWIFAAAVASGVAAARTGGARSNALTELHAGLDALARGNFERRVAAARLGEFAATGAALDRLADMLLQTRQRMGPVATGLKSLSTQVAGTVADVSRAADDQEAAVEVVASHHASLDASIREIRNELEALAAANQESAASSLELGSSADQVAHSASFLDETVASSSTSLDALSESVQNAARNANEVERVAEKSAAAAHQMNQAVQSVVQHVQGSAELTAAVAERAEEGSRAVGSTIDGIREIRGATLATREALAGLVRGIDTIAEIATVIRSITAETNLLSLNASIIAAQAGEHGRPFAVVANQVKELARRTSQNTERIDALIHDVQERSRAALESMAGGIESVDRGVTLSRVAGDALDHIRASAREASNRVAEIARAADEQGRSSKNVAEAARVTSQHVHEITAALTDQAQSAARLLDNARSSVQMCRQLASAAEEQRASCRDIARNNEAIIDRIASIQDATQKHEGTRKDVARTLEALLEVARRSAQRLPDLAQGVDSLQRQGEAMAIALARFEDARPDQDSDSPR